VSHINPIDVEIHLNISRLLKRYKWQDEPYNQQGVYTNSLQFDWSVLRYRVILGEFFSKKCLLGSGKHGN